MIELGGKIFLEGFEVLDQAELLVAKKLVGSYVRKACDSVDCQRVDLSLERESEGFHVSARVSMGGDQQKEAGASGKNVFMTIDAALKRLLEEIMK